MYTDFYNLTEKPFNLSPSSRFLYLGETHKEALALLTYGVSERMGFVLLTGEVGTGKTTIVHALLANLDETVRLVHLTNPLISPGEFLDYIARQALDRETPFHSKAEFLIRFEAFLRDCLQSRKNFLLIIDGAHKLSLELLEEILLLSNMETAEEKLINIVLVGQPELRERLSHPRCKALFQRITVQYQLEPLDQKSVGEYIRTRLRVAGAKEPDRIFPKSVIKAIYQCSKGYPRAINTVSDNVLLLGYVQDKKRITPAMVTECQDYMTFDTPQAEQDQKVKERSQAREAPSRSLSTPWKRFALALVLFVFALGLAIGFLRNDMLAPKTDSISMAKQRSGGMEEEFTPGGRTETPEDPSQQQLRETVPTERTALPQDVPRKEVDVRRAARRPPVATNENKDEQGTLSSAISPEMTGSRSGLESRDWHAWGGSITVIEGQTLRELALDTYGRADQAVLDMLKANNPAMEDINLILEGQRITFPPLSMAAAYESDDRISKGAPRPTPVDTVEEPIRDIYDRIDQDILRTLKEEHPESYRNFWEGLLITDREESPPCGHGVGGKEVAEQRISHFVQAASETQSAAPSVSGETGMLYPGALKAYGQLSVAEPFCYAPLLQDSVIYQETWQGDASLIHAVDLSEPRSFPASRAAVLQETLEGILRTVEPAPEQSAVEKDSIEAAIASLHQLLNQEPSLYEVHYNLGILYQAVEKLGKAEKEYQLALEQNPRNTKALLNLGLLLLQDGKVTEAESHFQRLNGLDPQFAGSFYLLGVCKHKRKAYADAEEDLKQSISLLPNFLYPYIELGSVQKKMGREEEARKSFLVVLHHPNASIQELHKLAYCLLESGRYQEAIAALDRILRTGNPHYEVWNNRAAAYLRKGQVDLARSDLNKAIEEDPVRPEAFNNMGIVHIQAKAYEYAATYFLHASKLETSARKALLNAAVVYGQYLDEPEKATTFARDYVNRGGTFQRHMLLKWLGSG